MNNNEINKMSITKFYFGKGGSGRSCTNSRLIKVGLLKKTMYNELKQGKKLGHWP